MFFIKSLRAKTILSALIPTALGLVAVAIIALYAYELLARDVVQQRDTELVRISAARVSDSLSEYIQALQILAADKDVQSMELLRAVDALAGASDQLALFDAGVVIYNSEANALWGRPVTPRRRGTEFPVPSEFAKVRETLQPVFSPIFYDEVTRKDAILVAVPVLDSEGEFTGVVAGLYTLSYSLGEATYSEALEFQTGQGGYAYLVDGKGRIINHPDSSQVGRDLADTEPVMRATSGETGAILTEDEMGETVISGFAPVPGTDWGLVTQQSWESVVGPIRGYSNLLLGLLAVGGVSSGALIFFFLGRVLGPIQDLTRGAQRIAGGDFDYDIVAETGDEVQALAEQFNSMAGALKESYADLERKVANRTKELAALNTVAQSVSQSLELEPMLSATLDKALEVLGFESGVIYLKNLKTGELEMGCHRGLSEEFRRAAARGLISARTAESRKPLIIDDLQKELDVPRELVEEGYRSVASIPLFSKGQVQGVLTTASRHLRRFRQQDVDLLLSIGNQIGVAIENARLFDAEQRRADQFSVISEAGRHIASILDVDELLKEIVRLLKETFGYYMITIGLIEGDEVVFKAGTKTGWDEAQFLPPSRKVGGQGITAWVAATGEPLLAPDVSKEPRFLFLPDSPETRSELVVPLKTKEMVIGVLNVESDQLNAFDESDLAVLQSLANQAGIAIENARLYEDIKSRLAQVSALQETTKAVASTLELDRLLNLMTEQATALLQADGGVLNLIDWDKKEDEVVASTGSVAGALGYRSPLEGSLSGWAALHNQPAISSQLEDDERVDRQALSWTFEMIGREVRSAAVAPLTIKDQAVGTLLLVDKEGGEGEFDQTDLDLLVAFANQAAAAIENARLFDAEQRRAEQFRVISEAGRHIISILDVDDLLGEIVRLVKETFGYHLVQIGLIEGDEMVFNVGLGPTFDDPQFQPPRVEVGEEGVTAWVAATGEPLLVPDVSQDPRYLLLPGWGEIKSELAVPLKTKSGIIGTLDVESDQLNAFDESDLVVLQSLARQAAIAIENARLFDAEQRRAEQFSVISEMGRHMTSILDVDELQREIVRSINENLGYPLVGIALIEGDELVFRIGSGPPFDDPHFEPPRIKVGGEGITGWVAAAGEPLLAADVSQQPRYLFLPGSEETQSELAVPLKTKTEVIGVLDVQSDRLDAFDESDLAVLQSVARQAAIAIEKARLFDVEQRRAEQFRVLSEVGARITSLLTVDELLDETVRLVRESLGYYLVSVGLIEGEELVFRTGAGGHWEDPGFQPPRLRVGEEGISGWVAATGEALLAPDVSQEPRFLAIPDVIETRSELAVPLKTKAEVIGVLDVESDQVNAFDETDLAVLQSVASLTAVALEEARLFDAEQRRAEQFRAISEMGRHMTSILDVDQLLDEIVRVIKETLGYYLVSIGLIEGDDVAFKTGAGPRWDDPEFQPTSMKVGEEGITGWVAGTGEALLVPDVSQEPRYVPLPDLVETRSELVVPLKTKEEVIGVLNVESDRMNAFDESDLMVLQSLANQAAIAIDNARLFDAEQRRAEQFSAISEMGRHITSILAVDELLNEIVRLIKETFGFYLVDIGLIEGDQLVFTTGADPSFDFSGEPLRVEVGSDGITGWVASTGEPQLVPDVSKDPRYVCLYAPTESRSELCVPIKAKEEVIGVLNVESDRVNAFDESDMMVLQSLANQAAIAIENARLYEQAQQAAALEERSRLARDLHDAVTQTLFSASLIGEVVPTLWESDQEEGRQLLQELRQLTRGALAEMRTLLLELRPAALAEASLDELLNQLAEAIIGRMGVPVTVAVEGECDFPSEVHVALYRIAQEALNNVVKHAQATQVAITLRCSPLADEVDGKPGQRVELLVSDDGRGFDRSGVPPDRLGLGIIRERAQAIGATVKIESQPGQGTQITAVWKG
jgi:GAF domain-containing protein/HAMP domain-containing protein/anti-sigma regulatory factor (Ser/Thr protein kinase)